MSDQTTQTTDVIKTVTETPDKTTTVTAAHIQKTTIHIRECIPAHEPRETDPHYKYFNQARARLQSLGKMVCWINNHDCSGDIELHHDKVEFSLANGVDIKKFEEAYPEFGITTDEQFLEYIEGEGNLTPLCRKHHIGILGIHVLPYPIWLPQKFWEDGLEAPASVVVSAGDAQSQSDQE